MHILNPQGLIQSFRLKIESIWFHHLICRNTKSQQKQFGHMILSPVTELGLDFRSLILSIISAAPLSLITDHYSFLLITQVTRFLLKGLNCTSLNNSVTTRLQQIHSLVHYLIKCFSIIVSISMYVPLVNDEVKFSQVVKIKWTFFIFTYGIKMYNLEKKKICSGLEMTSLFFFFF